MVHLIKLSVGSESVSGLTEWQAANRVFDHDGQLASWHVTRQMPRRADELIGQGSIYWVIQGEIRCRQPILDLKTVTGDDGVSRCMLILAHPAVPVVPVPRRPFQGWRYLKAEDAPEDLAGEGNAEMAAELRALGLL